MRTPYDTGKVKIGLYYEPPKYVESDPDMIAIQGWFLGHNSHAKRERLATKVLYFLMIVAVVLMLFYK